MIEKEFISQQVSSFLKNSSNFLVDIIIHQSSSITVEIDNEEGVCIDDCIELSKYLESKLDRDVEDFDLTVTSSGLTSPIKIARQYKKYIGKDLETLSKKGEKVSGTLKSFSDKGFTLSVTKKIKPEGAKRKINIQEDIFFQYEDVKQTKYLIRF